MKNRIIIVGKGGSGKDFLRKKMQDKEYVFFPSYTTRPPREGEEDGKDYFFVENSTFQSMIDKDEMEEFNEFPNSNGDVWFYGRTKDQFKQSSDIKSVMIMTPSGISRISDKNRKESIVVYLDIIEDILEDRLMRRKDGDDSYKRRLISDRKDFADFFDYDIIVSDHNFDVDDVLFTIDCFLDNDTE